MSCGGHSAASCSDCCPAAEAEDEVEVAPCEDSCSGDCAWAVGQCTAGICHICSLII